MAWFALSMKRIYLPVLKKIQKNITVFRHLSAIIVWILLALAVAILFILLRIESPKDGVRGGTIGLVAGFIIYGVYNFTNYATLYHYPLWLAFVDTVWGSFAMGLTGLLLTVVLTRFMSSKK